MCIEELVFGLYHDSSDGLRTEGYQSLRIRLEYHGSRHVDQLVRTLALWNHVFCLRYIALKLLSAACLSQNRHCNSVDYFDGHTSRSYGLDVLLQIVALKYYIGIYVLNYLKKVNPLGAAPNDGFGAVGQGLFSVRNF